MNAEVQPTSTAVLADLITRVRALEEGIGPRLQALEEGFERVVRSTGIAGLPAEVEQMIVSLGGEVKELKTALAALGSLTHSGGGFAAEAAKIYDAWHQQIKHLLDPHFTRTSPGGLPAARANDTLASAPSSEIGKPIPLIPQ